MTTTRDTDHVDRVLFEIWKLSPELWPRWKGAGTTSGLLLGLGLATGMEFYAYDGVNLVLPDVIRPHVGVFALISP